MFCVMSRARAEAGVVGEQLERSRIERVVHRCAQSTI
jgi:hypothetical protein